MKPLVYVAGPITADPLGAIRSALPVFDRLLRMGGVPFLPQLSVAAELVQARPYDQWLAYDLDVIARCDALVRIPGHSPGADREVAFAEGQRLFVVHLDGEDGWAELAEWLDGWTWLNGGAP